MHDFLRAFLGGLMLGAAVVGYLYLYGRIAGISGMLAQVLNPKTVLKTPALWFLVGLMLTPFLYTPLTTPDVELKATPLSMIVAGVLVGVGTRFASGCTSGHGICGISRLSKRSLVATFSFMLAGFITVYLMRHV